MALKVVTSSEREASEALASPSSLKLFSAILHNITLVIHDPGWADPALATTELWTVGPLQDIGRYATYSHTRGSKIVWPKQIKLSWTSPARNKLVHPLVVKIWHNVVFFLHFFPSLILSLCLCWIQFLMLRIYSCVYSLSLSLHFL